METIALVWFAGSVTWLVYKAVLRALRDNEYEPLFSNTWLLEAAMWPIITLASVIGLITLGLVLGVYFIVDEWREGA